MKNARGSMGWLRAASVAVVGFVWFQACSASDGREASPPGGSAGRGSGGNGGTNVVMPDGGPSPSEGGMGGYNSLCGARAEDCIPDEREACAEYVPPQEQQLSGGGATGARDGQAGAAGSGTANHEGGAGGVGGGPHEPGPGQAAGAAGSAGAGGETSPTLPVGGAAGQPSPTYACRVLQTSSGPSSQCAETGSGGLDAPCFTGADCGAGLACVGASSVARCRPYCCGGETACTPYVGTYCAELPLVDDSLKPREQLSVPVCAAAEQCDPLEPYPCPEEKVCQCPGETACSVVRSDGTTACVSPGSGAAGEACPCSPGHVCSKSAMTCLKLCAISAAADSIQGCGTGKCQASTELPRGLGVCVDVK